MLEVRNLTKVYDGKVRALDNVSFTVPDGQFLVVIGLSGSGKNHPSCAASTAWWSRPAGKFSGTGLTSPWRRRKRRRIRRRIGMVFQHFNLVNRSSVLTNVLAGRLGYINPAFSLINRFPKEDIDKALQKLERVGIREKAAVRVDELSGGQQQRVGIARALMQDPDLILADEPVASLDPVLAHSIMTHLEQINKQDGIMVICSLHFLDLVQRYADHVIALNQGALVFEGKAKDIDDQRFKEIYGQEAERVGDAKH